MILLNCFGNYPTEGIDDFGINFLDIYTFSFISFLMVVVFITVKVRNRKCLTHESLEKDILGQEKTIAISGKNLPPFSTIPAKKVYQMLFICVFLICTIIAILEVSGVR